MAKIILKPNEDINAVAKQLAHVGITVDTHPLGNNTYRAYVRKENMELFREFINSQTEN